MKLRILFTEGEQGDWQPVVDSADTRCVLCGLPTPGQRVCGKCNNNEEGESDED